ncbi:MAG: cyclic beta 1-2 glucan synthetase, partial [Casimicrobiaceae bacterium]
MEQHGKRLALAHRISARRAEDRLLPRLADNEVLLLDACELLTAAVRADRRITPAGEWLLDNFYLIEEQIRTAKRHLPRDYSRQLPCLDSGLSAGLPRVYDIALETIAHGDGRVDPESLSRFIAAYQTVTPIMLGELWAIPIMLRLALIENLRRVGSDVAAGRIDRDLADSWADQMVTVAEADPKSLVLVIADMARSNPPMTTAFVAELSRRLRGHGSALALPLTWIEQRLAEDNLTIDQLVQASTHQQAANQVSISNSIGSLRFLGAMDWRTFVESMSVVERTLRQDPAGIYSRMDFVTRDSFRHVIEELARDVNMPEPEVAQAAIALASDAGGGPDGRVEARRHVGYYLIDAGRPTLEQAIGVRPAGAAAWLRWLARAPTALYLGTVGAITLLLTAAMMSVAMASPLSSPLVALTLIVVLVATSQLAVALANWLVDTLVSPAPLPRLELEAGIPASLRTLVAVPAMLTSSGGVEALVEALEVRYLANRDDNLHFALLTDFVDATAATTPGDAPLLQLAQQRIGALNAKYRVAAGSNVAASPGNAFYLLHRPRLWNPGEKLWMGYERKRGKLGAVNALLRGEAGASARFSCIVGDTAALLGTKYVITLDSDTELPRDAARQLVGAMAHPLNSPYFDVAQRRVTAGYTILQPRMVTSLPSSNRSQFARTFGGEPGIDPYTRAVSDVYQDAFDEGSFIGKGIYDVDAFEQALGGRFPENRILSHDLLEGAYARSGLITDVQLYDSYPAHYSTDVSRRRRWIRGDWQIAGWLLRTVPAPDGARERNPLSWLSQWKIFDNLRRSVVPFAMLVLLMLAWTVLAPAWWWTVMVLGVAVVPAMMATLLDMLRKPSEVSLRQHLVFTTRSAARRGVQLLFSLACLPYETYFSVAAILTTHWRMLISRRKRLEWTPSSELVPYDRASLQASVRAMWFAPAFALVMAIVLQRVHPAALPIAAPLLLLWFVSPAFAWWMSRPAHPRPPVLTVDQRRFLRTLARQTWGYFETFVSAADNWLPPDNFQVVPTGTIAHRTSPTNMGMALLADLAAYDFGFMTAGRLVERCGNTLQSMRGLERSFGHFYNWYDTQTGKPLPPRYISTVDSGNLAGHLLTLRAGLLALPDAPIVDWRVITGVADTLQVLRNALGATVPVAFVQLQGEIAAAALSPPPSLAAMAAAWRHLAALMIGAIAALREASAADGNDAAHAEIAHWTGALEAQWQTIGDEWLAPFMWLESGASDGTREGMSAHDRIPTWRALAAIDPCPASEVARARVAAIDALAVQCDALARMDFRLLYDKARHLFVVGYNVDDR